MNEIRVKVCVGVLKGALLLLFQQEGMSAGDLSWTE